MKNKNPSQCHYHRCIIAGSGATAFGTMPGISLHTELQILSHAGLTNRQVLASATNNYSILWDWKHIGKI